MPCQSGDPSPGLGSHADHTFPFGCEGMDWDTSRVLTSHNIYIFQLNFHFVRKKVCHLPGPDFDLINYLWAVKRVDYLLQGKSKTIFQVPGLC